MHERKNIRLKEYDYSKKGKYFITICTWKMEPYFGKIINGEMIYSDIGKIANQYLQDIPDHFNHIVMQEYVVMPNHIHCILEIVGSRHGVTEKTAKKKQFSHQIKGSISVVVGQYKSSVTRWANNNKHGYFSWQKRFYERIVRDKEEFDNIKKYIRENPFRWNNEKYFK